MSDFAPGVDRMRAAGYVLEARPYPGGPEGIQESIETVAKKIRDGRLDADVRGWAGDVLIAAGSPTRIRDQARAILNAFRARTMYLPDPVGAEYVVSASGTVCLRPGLCVRARDCDDGVVAVGSALMSVGIPIVVVKQYFGAEAPQQHVLLEARDEDGLPFAIDPSPPDFDIGMRVPAMSEERINPMDVVGSLGTKGQEIVSLGAFGLRRRDVRFDGSFWRERRYGREYIHVEGEWRELRASRVGLGQTPAPTPNVVGTPWQIVTDNLVHAGLRYRVKFLATRLGASSTLPTTDRVQGYRDARASGYAEAYLRMLLEGVWLVETLTQTSDVSGGVDSWELVAVAKQDATLHDDALVAITGVWVQAASAPGKPPGQPQPPSPVPLPKPPPPSGTISAPAVLVTAAGVSVAGGLIWYAVRKRPARRRKAA